MLRPTPGDPWGVEQHHWNTGANENQQLNPGGPSNRQKSSGPNQIKYLKFNSSNTEEYKYPFNLVELKEAVNKSHDTATGADEVHYQILKQLPLSPFKHF